MDFKRLPAFEKLLFIKSKYTLIPYFDQRNQSMCPINRNLPYMFHKTFMFLFPNSLFDLSKDKFINQLLFLLFRGTFTRVYAGKFT